MTPKKPRQSGRFVKNALVRPAVEVDCSTWGEDDVAAPRRAGRFRKTAAVRPAVEVDGSGWPEAPAVSLELTLQPGPLAEPLRLAVGMFDVVIAVDRLERALGGAGLTRVSSQQINGVVRITLSPEEGHGAADRIHQICDHINRATPTTTDFPLPAVVISVLARVV